MSTRSRHNPHLHLDITIHHPQLGAQPTLMTSMKQDPIMSSFRESIIPMAMEHHPGLRLNMLDMDPVDVVRLRLLLRPILAQPPAVPTTRDHQLVGHTTQ